MGEFGQLSVQVPLPLPLHLSAEAVGGSVPADERVHWGSATLLGERPNVIENRFALT